VTLRYLAKDLELSLKIDKSEYLNSVPKELDDDWATREPEELAVMGVERE